MPKFNLKNMYIIVYYFTFHCPFSKPVPRIQEMCDGHRKPEDSSLEISRLFAIES